MDLLLDLLSAPGREEVFFAKNVFYLMDRVIHCNNDRAGSAVGFAGTGFIVPKGMQHR